MTKMASRKEREKSFDDFRSSQTKMEGRKGAKHVVNMPRSQKGSCLDEEADKGNIRSSMEGSLEGSVKKRKTLRELHMNPPLGFREFESEVD